MIRSMTGFGRGEADTELGHISIEVKSVNSRSCGISFKLPETLLSLENQASSFIRTKVSRGQVNVSVALCRDGVASGRRIVVDRELAKELFRLWSELNENFSTVAPVGLDSITALPGVITIEEPKIDPEKLWLTVRDVLGVAVDQLIEAREKEGLAIQAELLERLDNMLNLVDRINTRAPAVIDEYRERLQRRLSELLRGEIAIDDSRIATEVAIMADRCDITEELVRLRSHISQIRGNLREATEPVGRRLDFILQEINREVNTIASKSNDTQIATDCIQFKDETEKMREQVQNVE